MCFVTAKRAAYGFAAVVEVNCGDDDVVVAAEEVMQFQTYLAAQEKSESDLVDQQWSLHILVQRVSNRQ